MPDCTYSTSNKSIRKNDFIESYERDMLIIPDLPTPPIKIAEIHLSLALL